MPIDCGHYGTQSRYVGSAFGKLTSSFGGSVTRYRDETHSQCLDAITFQTYAIEPQHYLAFLKPFLCVALTHYELESSTAWSPAFTHSYTIYASTATAMQRLLSPRFTRHLSSASAGITAAQSFGPQGDTTATIPTLIPSFATALLPASSLSTVPTLPPASPSLAIPLPSLILAQHSVALYPTTTPAPAALMSDAIPFDPQSALPSDGATPWWVVTEFLQPHGLPTEPSYVLLPPPLIPEPTATRDEESLSTVTNLLGPTLEPLPSSVNLGSPVIDEPAVPFPDVFAFDPDDWLWPFAAPYSPQAQPPILSPSFKPDAQGNLPTKKDITNRYATSDSTDSGVIETGKLIADVWTYEFYDTGLVHIDDTFLNPSTNIWGYLPDGTRIGLDSAGVYIGWEKRVPYGPEMLDVMKAFWLPEPQWFI
ncbi:uncharacterized protein EKO05_0000014 [Ascochyta rabiei]|uniref:uncharacterized protein n=1 Tax=Didymella rabiei TaxID=5454 RepID=UPI0021FCF8D2|nr:uncharacterized protein EKO05_0000014 [Ascochyta rabiei]UPX09323.1 hypothetical protein EKO05_0000014 [Ascochyta rabiei]